MRLLSSKSVNEKVYRKSVDVTCSLAFLFSCTKIFSFSLLGLLQVGEQVNCFVLFSLIRYANIR